MAKVVAAFDTKEKTLTVNLDGKSVANIAEVVMYQSYDGKDYTMSLCTMARDDAEGIMRMERIVAKDSGDGKKALASGQAQPTNHDEFVKVNEGLKVLQDEINAMSVGLFKRSR